MNGTSVRVLSPITALAAVCAVACGSSGDKGSSVCTTPEIVGTVFGGTGTASVSGTGTLPDGIKDGLEVGVLIDLPNESLGVLPDDIFMTNDRVCGKSVRYTAKALSAGTYRLGFDIHDPNSDSTDALFEGESTTDFTVTDGQALMLDVTFQLNPK